MAIRTLSEYQAAAAAELGKDAKPDAIANRAMALMSADIAALTKRAEVAEAKASGIAARLTLKVSAKGAVSVYGLGRFPVTLYREQWARLLEQSGAIHRFISANSAALKSKGDDAADEPATGTDGQ